MAGASGGGGGDAKELKKLQAKLKEKDELILQLRGDQVTQLFLTLWLTVTWEVGGVESPEKQLKMAERQIRDGERTQRQLQHEVDSLRSQLHEAGVEPQPTGSVKLPAASASYTEGRHGHEEMGEGKAMFNLDRYISLAGASPNTRTPTPMSTGPVATPQSVAQMVDRGGPSSHKEVT